MKFLSEIGKKKIVLICVGILGVVGAAVCVWYLSHADDSVTSMSFVGAPTLTVETPQKVSVSESDELVLDLKMQRFGDALYPAASFSISFDSSRLEFLGIQEGNVFVLNHEEDTQVDQMLPEWSCNVEQSNKSGLINIMYLDLTGGNHAFSQELLAEDDNVVLRLAFRVRGSVRAGDICDVIVEDAVFAASDETKSLSMIQDTLKVKNGKIVMGH